MSEREKYIAFAILGIVLAVAGFTFVGFRIQQIDDGLADFGRVIGVIGCLIFLAAYHIGLKRPKQINHLGESQHLTDTLGEKSSDDDQVRCPVCRSSNITAQRKGYGLGKGAVGGAVLGPIGLLGGFVGSRKVRITCLKCGHQWTAGK